VTQTPKDICYASAMRLLVRREHSALELKQKLSAKGIDAEIIDIVISKLINQNYQSDERFAEGFIQMRFNQGKGPIKITHELNQRGVEDYCFSDFDFFSLAKKTRQNKFGHELPEEFKEEAKQKRFLQSRGFSFDHIDNAFK